MPLVLSPKEAETQLLQQLRVLPMETCALADALGRILRLEVKSDRPSPPYDRVMMDGVALCQAELPADGLFQCVAETPAGVPGYEEPLSVGEAVEVSTGSVMPCHADTVVPVENLIAEDAGFRITELPEPGCFVHRAGSDLPAGNTVLPAGKKLGARDLSLAGGYGATVLEVSKLPVVGVLTSGTELVEVSAEPLPHQIRRSNDLAVTGMLQEAGFATCQPLHLPDDPDQIREALAGLLQRCDVLFVCGGISKGKHDYLPELLQELGCDQVFRKVAQKPGGPFGFWQHDSCQVFGLPGNPLSTFVCTARYSIPYLRAMCGASDPFATQPVRTAVEIKPHAKLTLFKPYELDDSGSARPVAFQNSGDLLRPLNTPGLLCVPPGDAPLPAHSVLSCLPW